MNPLEALIPGVAAVLLLAFPKLLIKSEGTQFEKTKKKLRILGFVLLGVSVLYLVIGLANV